VKVVFIDVRFGELRDIEEEQLRPIFLWLLQYDEDGKIQVNQAPANKGEWDMKAALGLILERMWGDRSRWEKVRSY